MLQVKVEHLVGAELQDDDSCLEGSFRIVFLFSLAEGVLLKMNFLLLSFLPLFSSTNYLFFILPWLSPPHTPLDSLFIWNLPFAN